MLFCLNWQDFDALAVGRNPLSGLRSLKAEELRLREGVHFTFVTKPTGA